MGSTFKGFHPGAVEEIAHNCENEAHVIESVIKNINSIISESAAHDGHGLEPVNIQEDWDDHLSASLRELAVKLREASQRYRGFVQEQLEVSRH